MVNNSIMVTSCRRSLRLEALTIISSIQEPVKHSSLDATPLPFGCACANEEITAVNTDNENAVVVFILITLTSLFMCSRARV